MSGPKTIHDYLKEIGKFLAMLLMMAILIGGSFTIAIMSYEEGGKAERAKQQAAAKEVYSMLMVYDTSPEQLRLAKLKAEQMKVIFGGQWVVVRRRVGVRDFKPQGYVVLTREQMAALGLAHLEYVTVYDTAAKENRDDS